MKVEGMSVQNVIAFSHACVGRHHDIQSFSTDDTPLRQDATES